MIELVHHNTAQWTVSIESGQSRVEFKKGALSLTGQ